MFEMLLGHLIGDYLFQTDKMALNKSKNSLYGWLMCFIHTMIYSSTICIMMNKPDTKWFFLVFMSHFPIDKFSLANYWMKMMGKITPMDYYKQFKYDVVNPMDHLTASFSSIVYCVVDNTLHLVLMYFGWRILYGQ